jgi:hypothetical protein
LDAPEDPFKFAAHYLGRWLGAEDARWLAVGKESPLPGLVCDACGTELDHDGDYLRLVHTPNARLARFSGQPHTLEDLHRLAANLPMVGDEKATHDALAEAIQDSYTKSEIGFDGADVAWRGDAVRTSDGVKGSLLLNSRELVFGGLLRKFRMPADSITSAEADGDTLHLSLTGSREPASFLLSPQQLHISLRSGERIVDLDAADLAARIRATRS